MDNGAIIDLVFTNIAGKVSSVIIGITKQFGYHMQTNKFYKSHTFSVKSNRNIG